MTRLPFARAKLLRAAVFVALGLAALTSFQLQLESNDSPSLRHLTSNFVTTKTQFCLTTTPMASKASGFGRQTFSARAIMQQPVQSSGLIIGVLGDVRQGRCYRASLRFSPGFENSRIFFVAKLAAADGLKSVELRRGGADMIGGFWQKPVSKLRGEFLSHLSGLTPDSAGLVAGLAIGDTSRVSARVLSDFKVLSLTHLTAVSGTNCAIVLGLVWLLLARVRIGQLAITRWPRFFLSALALLSYLALVGPQPSVLRAGAMTLTVLLAKTLGRSISALSALALACAVLLVIDPWLFFDYGFALSVLACLGILVLAPVLARWLQLRFDWVPRWLVIGIAVSCSAQLLCLPVLLLLQPGLSTYSVLANLVAEPLVLPVTVLGLFAVVCAVVAPPLTALLSFTASIFTSLIIWLANVMALWPAATGFWPAGSTGEWLAVGLTASTLLAAIGRNLSLRLVGLSAGLLALVVVAGLATVHAVKSTSWATPGWFMVSCDVGQGDATVIRSEGKVAVIDVGREPAMVDACLKQLHVNQIDLLVLTHFDLDHVGGLSGALNHRQVSTAMLTPFVDTRPGADAARLQLESQHIAVVLAETGLSGVLGRFSWQVLSPHQGGFEAEDSNDGSITMLWRSKTVDIITLADLGEKGQMRLAAESSGWMNAQLSHVALIMKVSHHGSADQYPELIEALHPALALVSVGKDNSYGHPTARTLSLLAQVGAVIERTDEHGSISVAQNDAGLALGFQGEQGKTG